MVSGVVVREFDGAVFLVVWQDENRLRWSTLLSRSQLGLLAQHDRLTGSQRASTAPPTRTRRCADVHDSGAAWGRSLPCSTTPHKEINSEELFVGHELLVDENGNICLSASLVSPSRKHHRRVDAFGREIRQRRGRGRVARIPGGKRTSRVVFTRRRSRTRRTQSLSIATQPARVRRSEMPYTAESGGAAMSAHSLL